MTGRSASAGIAMAILVLLIVVAIILIPWLDEQLQRAVAQKEAAEAAANDNAQAASLGAERQIG